MVRTIKNESRATGNRTKFTDDQPIMIDRVLIQYIVLLKITGTSSKIIINRILADRDI